MKSTILLPLMILGLLSCSKSEVSNEKEFKEKSSEDIKVKPELTNQILADTTIKVLWRENQYDAELQDSLPTIILNDNYLNSISDQEKATIGYVSTFVGNDCDWDGEAKEDYSNLKCKIITALNLGHQCSDTHLNFLKKSFGFDSLLVAKLNNCPTTPYTATSQTTFDEITITTNKNKITVWFKASGVNLRSMSNWAWTETNYFKVNDNGSLSLLKTEESKIE